MTDHAGDLRLVAASDLEIRGWSYGRISRIGSEAGGLLDPRVFGYDKDYACPCGQFRGDPTIPERICSRCGVPIGKAADLRSQRCGHIDLCTSLVHPLARTHLLTTLCVIPVEHRLNEPSGVIACRYVEIVELDNQLRAIATQRRMPTCELLDESAFADVCGHLQAACERLMIGGDDDGPCLLSLLSLDLRRAGPWFHSLVRGLGMTFEIRCRL